MESARSKLPNDCITHKTVGCSKDICSISSRSRVLAHRPCPKLEMFCPSVLQLFYGCSKVLMTNHGIKQCESSCTCKFCSVHQRMPQNRGTALIIQTPLSGSNGCNEVFNIMFSCELMLKDRASREHIGYKEPGPNKKLAINIHFLGSANFLYLTSRGFLIDLLATSSLLP